MLRRRLRLRIAMRFRLNSRPASGRPRVHPIFVAVGALLALAGAAFAAVQALGDPAAGGPRQVVSLSPGPASAEAAPRLTLEDALISGDGLQLQDMPPAEVLTPDAASAEAAQGELRIAVVNADRPRAAARPLPRAPFAGMTEPGPLGVLPIVGRNGRTPAQAYARPFSGPAQRPKVAIIVGGLGFNARNTTQAIDELPPEVTLSFVPYSANLQSWIDRARAAGHEVMLELPMEPFDPEADDTGPQTLLAAAEPAQNIARLENLLSRGAGYFGVTNYQGARFAASPAATGPVAQALQRRGLAFLSAGLGQRTALSVEAARARLPLASADRIIDARREAEAIDEQLLNLEALALQNGSAIGAGFAYPVTMQQISDWAAAAGDRGYVLAPASTVIAARTQR
ncbi:MAG: divergent polysaccharide deacetylase family protein [Alphaproteobacteria bacterium]|nr:divergent polysaccharide deacetylase family protein [Alphaproteobacteria bacterium]